jgi:hypothetical protein
MESIGNILYSIINEIGKEKIQTDITVNVGLSRQYIQMIMKQCSKLVNLKNQENIGSLCEALLHFMLTICTLPSVRKVRIDEIDLDVVIPSLHVLRNFPEKAIIIQIEKELRPILNDKQEDIARIQPNADNIWVITKEPSSGDYVNYVAECENFTSTSVQRRNFHDIIVDIDSFLEKMNDRSFRFFH